MHGSCWSATAGSTAACRPGEPLKLLEERAGLPVAEVTEIMRQSGDYRKAAMALSDGRTAEGFAELDRLGWIREVPDADRYQELAAAYLAAVQEKKRGGEPKTALVVSPTHAEAARITDTIRAALQARGQARGGADARRLGAGPPDRARESRRDQLRAGRHAAVPPERAGPQERLRAWSWPKGEAAAALCRSLRGLPAGAADAGGRRPRPHHRQRQDQGRQAPAEQRRSVHGARASRRRAIPSSTAAG